MPQHYWLCPNADVRGYVRSWMDDIQVDRRSALKNLSGGDLESMRSAWAVLATATLLAVRLEALIAGVTPQQIVDLLNSARANVVPTAAHMVKLEWDDTLAAAAASYAATQCSAQFSGQGPSCPNCVSWTADAELPSYGSHGILDVIAGNFIAAVRTSHRTSRRRT